MSSAFFLFIFFFLPSLGALSDVTPSEEQPLNTQALIMQACSHVGNQSSCLTNFQAELEKSSPAAHSVLHAALRATLNEAMRAIDMITKFNSLSVSYREQIAIEDCKELLDFSVSELAWSLAEMNKIRAGIKNVHYEGNLKAWLSAALSNPDTCLEGFEGTDRHLENFIRGSLKEVTQLIGNVLALYTQLHSLPFKPPRNDNATTTNSSSDKFPEWMTEGDQELLKGSSLGMHVNAIVAIDGTGHYRTITQAINEAPSYSNRRYIIYVKKGVYRENIDMKRKKANIMFIGDGIGQTVVTGNRNFMQGWTTFRTATVGDMEGYQDTLYAHSLRQFYRECEIYGTIDYIFGNGAAVFQNCKIYTRVPLPLQKSTGFSIQDSYIFASQPTYLGRPWKQYSRTVFMNTYMSALVQPRGWLEWYGNFALGTLWYGEYKNHGPGALLSGRVKWPGYHIIQDAAAAKFFTAAQFIDGMSWLPSTGVKFTAGLSN
ncbi:pectinesterase/pectinesterase inhibitor [Salix suchowensis]|nr:pectinesterase/pectinesterase inhibitor [Salix suchowensis]